VRCSAMTTQAVIGLFFSLAIVYLP
jgi:hypothetical protein